MSERQLSLLKGPRQRGVTVRSQASEFELHCAVIDTFRVSKNKGWRAIHIPNGEYRLRSTGAKLARMGVHAGVSDLLVTGPGPRYCWLELKTKYGRLTDEQQEWQDYLASIGAERAVAWTYEEAIRRLKGWGAVRTSI